MAVASTARRRHRPVQQGTRSRRFA